MARDKSTLRFWLRTDRSNKDGSAPIHLIYSIHGQRKYFQIPKIKLFSINWDPEIQHAIYLDRKAAKKIESGFDPDLLLPSKQVDEINNTLDEVESDIDKVEKYFEHGKKESYSSEDVIEHYKQT